MPSVANEQHTVVENAYFEYVRRFSGIFKGFTYTRAHTHKYTSLHKANLCSTLPLTVASSFNPGHHVCG